MVSTAVLHVRNPDMHPKKLFVELELSKAVAEEAQGIHASEFIGLGGLQSHEIRIDKSTARQSLVKVPNEI